MIYLNRYDETWLKTFEPCLHVHSVPYYRMQSIMEKRVKRDQTHSFIASVMLVNALRDQDIDAYTIETRLTPHGKLVLLTNPLMYVSISHTFGAVMIALSSTEIGIDIEKVKPISKKVIERITGDTYADNDYLNLSDGAKTTLFTTFESCVKYLGLSMFTDPLHVSALIKQSNAQTFTLFHEDYVISYTSLHPCEVLNISPDSLIESIKLLKKQE